ncbi:MAG: 50S ribosomal protein L25 [Candidatus Latescibacteria bacterium]|nr:50S ribosomal protein L25 [Candidatus Latescibacterota bacterium]
MPEELVMRAKRRTETGKGHSKRLRKQGIIPGVLYGPEEDPTPIEIERVQMEELLHAGGETSLVTLLLGRERKRDRKTIVRDLQYDPIHGDLTHVDFQHISLTQTINVEIPISVVGIPDGVRNSEGILDHTMHSLELSCLPMEIPDHVEVDVTELGLGQSIQVADLLEQESRIISDPERVVLSVILPKKAALVEEVEEEEKLAEPEVIGEQEEEAEEE